MNALSQIVKNAFVLSKYYDDDNEHKVSDVIAVQSMKSLEINPSSLLVTTPGQRTLWKKRVASCQTSLLIIPMLAVDLWVSKWLLKVNQTSKPISRRDLCLVTMKRSAQQRTHQNSARLCVREIAKKNGIFLHVYWKQSVRPVFVRLPVIYDTRS